MGFVEIDGLRIHYHTIGELRPARGQCVLYVHGTGCNTKVWQPHMAAVAAAHTPVAIDLPGHGQSTGSGFRGVASALSQGKPLSCAVSPLRIIPDSGFSPKKS
jgi:pimeloyl-ACP methyl ester carboxylesterase